MYEASTTSHHPKLATPSSPPTPPPCLPSPQDKNPNAKVISLGIGDTTEPLPQYIADAMAKAAAGLATREGYSG